MPAALIAGTVVGAIVKGKAEKQAAQAQVDASNAAIVEQRRQYDQTRHDQMPWMTAGTQAVNALANPQGSFQASPGYQFRLSEGQRDIGHRPDSDHLAHRGLQDDGPPDDRLEVDDRDLGRVDAIRRHDRDADHSLELCGCCHERRSRDRGDDRRHACFVPAYSRVDDACPCGHGLSGHRAGDRSQRYDNCRREGQGEMGNRS